MNTANQKSTADLQLAFDVGHSSIGWAVLSANGGQPPALLGCGSVIFPADDCLASERRGFRRQRRHIRATRLRIARLKRLLAHLGVLTNEQLDAPGCAWPWLLAARVLRGGKKLTWSELWDVLRWYAHNRGYDGNKGWSRQDLDSKAKKEDTEKVKAALALYEKHGTHTMSETWCAVCGLDPLGEKRSACLPGAERPRGLNAAFPREDIEGEVERILSAHTGVLPAVDENLVTAVMRDHSVIVGPEYGLPKHFGQRVAGCRAPGGLLFGQLIPRFDNRIIGECPFTGKHVPARACREFLDFRWTMLMAGIGIAFPSDEELRPLNPEERLALDRRGRELGFFRYDREKVEKRTGEIKKGRNELREELRALTGCDRDNLDALLFDDNMREALKVVPITGDPEAFRIAWGAFDGPTRDEETGAYIYDRLRGRFITMMLRGTRENPVTLSVSEMIAMLEKWGANEVAARMRIRMSEVAVKKGKPDAKKLAELESACFGLDRLSGRAPYGRKVMELAVRDWMRRDAPLHPAKKGGTIERTEAVLEAERQRLMDEATNNHLVRHRLRVLAGDPHASPKPFRGLLDDLVTEYAGGDLNRVSRITVEVARNLQEMSGLKSTEKKPLLNQKLESHEQAAAALAETMRAEGIPFVESDGRPKFTASLIRKARIALDLADTDEAKRRNAPAFRCPYTDRFYCLADVARGKVERDHIIPRSKRLSDALEAMVLTAPEVNRDKKNRTALEFVRDMNREENRAQRDALGIVTERRFLEIVHGLWPKANPFLRARAGGPRATDDEARCWRRRELLQVPKWEAQEFTPADLAKTHYITKLARQRLEGRFPEGARPAMITVKGAVTKTFRDRAWKLLPLLCDYTDKANETPINALFADWRKSLADGKPFNLKKALREVTHMHHALDAAAVGLIADLLAPLPQPGIDGRLETLIIKGKLDPAEREEFMALCARLRLPRFFKWAVRENKHAIDIDDLPRPLKEQLHRCLAERRVVQHVPKEMSGLPAELNAWRVMKVENGTVTLHQRNRQADGSRPLKQASEKATKLIGLVPGKLSSLKAALVVKDNYGLALDPTPTIIPFHKVWPRLKELREENGDEPVRVLRKGMLVRLRNTQPNGNRDGIWRIYTVQATLKIDLVKPDVFGRPKKGPVVWREVSVDSLGADNIEILPPSLCGVAL